MLAAFAEDLGLINAITNQLFGQACRDATTWRNSISLSFNFSHTQLREGSFPPSVMTILHQTGLSPHRLEVEVTEIALIQDLSAVYATASGSSKDPSSIGEATAKQRAEDHEVALTAAVARKADQWRPKCKEGCKGRIRIVSGPDHDTVTHPILDPRHHVDVVGWEATLTVWEVVSAACVPSPG